jgi:hypothetical protein
MKAIFYFGILFSLMMSCSNLTSEDKDANGHSPLDLVSNKDEVICPNGGHVDNIIPIEYGYPSAEMWEKADSGLVALGGCEVEDYNYYCKIHQISFE